MAHLPSESLIVDIFLSEVDVSNMTVQELVENLKDSIMKNFLPFAILILDSHAMILRLFSDICNRGDWVLIMPDGGIFSLFSYQHGLEIIQDLIYRRYDIWIPDLDVIFVDWALQGHFYRFGRDSFELLKRVNE